jgi:hypothetical protein
MQRAVKSETYRAQFKIIRQMNQQPEGQEALFLAASPEGTVLTVASDLSERDRKSSLVFISTITTLFIAGCKAG